MSNVIHVDFGNPFRSGNPDTNKLFSLELTMKKEMERYNDSVDPRKAITIRPAVEESVNDFNEWLIQMGYDGDIRVTFSPGLAASCVYFNCVLG